MDAVHLIRADRAGPILKVEGATTGTTTRWRCRCSPSPTTTSARPSGPATSDNTGIPDAIMDLVTVVPFNDLGAVERALGEHPGRSPG